MDKIIKHKWAIIGGGYIAFLMYESFRLIGELPTHPTEPYTIWDAVSALTIFTAVFILGYKLKENYG